MKLSPDALGGHLARGLAPAYLLCGDEPLLVGEAADAVRARARAAGFTDRVVHFIERGSSWADVRAEADSLSLFASRRILELRMPTGKPGASGSATIVDLVERQDPDTLLLILTERLDRDAQGASWVRAIDAHGVVLTAWPIGRDKLPAWLEARARRAGLQLEPEALALLADRTEGNLLAARQEIDRLALGTRHGRVGVAELTASVGDSARFDVFALGAAARAGNAARTLRIVAGLRAEGVEAPLVLWSLLREARQLLRDGGRFTRRDAPRLIGRARRVDRAIKGRLQSDAWDELALLAAELCGRTPLTGSY
ncbi:MAG TPA: DNA polymerase III subunit delta [Steroidobacteraceae bacterium]|nr:DNA polymerase III subunit delta [Steroidobacteraceae bacterium]HNS28857.1 DNA polymerase III subunit delta [Steroidobacteraceae bacterium]